MLMAYSNRKLSLTTCATSFLLHPQYADTDERVQIMIINLGERWVCVSIQDHQQTRNKHS